MGQILLHIFTEKSWLGAGEKEKLIKVTKIT